MRSLLTIAVACVTALILAETGFPQDDSVSGAPYYPDLLGPAFTEMVLDADGVRAVDTMGQAWYYSFDEGRFILGVDTLARQTGPLPTDRGSIEERATQLLVLAPFEQRSVIVREDEYVEGDVLAWDRITVRGWVKGDVKSVRGKVLVTPTGRVDGDVEALQVTVREGGTVAGRIIETASPINVSELAESFSADGLIVAICFTVFMALVTFLLLTLTPRHHRRVMDAITTHRAKSFLVGLLLVIGMPAVILAVVITVIGILLLPFLPLAYLAAFCLGMLAYGCLLGGRVAVKLPALVGRPMLQGQVGVFLLMAPWLVAALAMGKSNSVWYGFGVALLVISILITTFAVCSGVGAVVLTRFGFREYVGRAGRAQERAAPPPAPPPIPEPPVIPARPIDMLNPATSPDQSRRSNQMEPPDRNANEPDNTQG